MDTIRLIKPSMDYAEDIMAYRREYLANDPDEDMDGANDLKKYSSAEEWLSQLEKRSRPETCPENRAPSDTLIAVRQSDNKIVGIIDLRHHIDNPVLKEWGGHIGYCVRPDARRKGYAKEMLRLDLEYARKIGLKKVMVTCYADNIASERTILANGGVFERETTDGKGHTVKRYWITL